jgi:hypothetical protein
MIISGCGVLPGCGSKWIKLCQNKPVNKSGGSQLKRAAIVDSQSVKTTEVALEVGYEGAKLTKGHKPHVKSRYLGIAAPSCSACCQRQRNSWHPVE